MRAERVPVVPEKKVQQAIKQLLRLRGVPYYDLSQPRAAMQTPGLADLLIMVPLRSDVAQMIWVEVKSERGQLSEAQRTFQELCQRCRVGYWVIRSAAEMDARLTRMET